MFEVSLYVCTCVRGPGAWHVYGVVITRYDACAMI